MTNRDDPTTGREDNSETRGRASNPSIRALARCLRRLDEVLESDYAFLHCSPERLQLIWSRVVEVRAGLRDEVRPLLAKPSENPRLEASRQSASTSLDLMSRSLLADLDRFPGRLADEQLPAARRLLCATMGQIHAFLADTLSELLSAEMGEAAGHDYWLSKRLPRDIEESEWLAASVDRLQDYMRSLGSGKLDDLRRVAARVHRERVLPRGEPWERVDRFLDEVMEVLVPRLRAVRALQGIRYDDMEILDRYLLELPVLCRTLAELHTLDRRLADSLPAADRRDGEPEAAGIAHVLIGESSVRKLDQLERALRDLTAFVGLWSRGIRQRRALRFRESD